MNESQRFWIGFRHTSKLSPKEKALLNKVYRAVHDLVCPRCGADMEEATPVIEEFRCRDCGFTVSQIQMLAMRAVIVDWGREAVEFFGEWAKENP